MLSLIESETQMISRLFVYVLGNIWSQCRRLTDLCWVLKSDWARGAPVKPPGLFFVIWLVVRGGKEQYGTQTAYFPLLRQCCNCAKKYANNPFLKHKKCCRVLQCASYSSVFLCCYGGDVGRHYSSIFLYGKGVAVFQVIQLISIPPDCFTVAEL